MDPISRLNRVMALMRSRQSGRPQQAGQAGAAKAQAAAPRGAAANPESVREHIAACMQGIDLATPAGQEQGVKVFLEAVLLKEWGRGMLNSPRFKTLLAEVQGVLESDPDVRAELMALLKELKG